MSESEAGAEEAAQPSEPDSGEAGPRSLAVIDPSPEGRAQAEELADAVGRPIWTLDPNELGPHSYDEFLEAGALVVAWDLGGRPGLDLLEALVRDERTRDLPIAMAAEKPTRDQVLLALRWGARTFLQLPYEAEELRERLGEARVEAEDGAGDSQQAEG